MLTSLAFDLAVIDLDNTLYAADNGVFARMDVRMNNYIQRELHLSLAKANAMRVNYWKAYGSTLRGLMIHHGHDAEPFLREVHDVAAHELLKPVPELFQALQAIKAKKIIHTNGTRKHAEQVLNCLGVSDCFAAIYDIRFNAYQPKPCTQTLKKLFALEQVDAGAVVVIDDMPANLAAAKLAGAKTAWVHADAATVPHAWDVAAPTFAGLLNGLAGISGD